jgi:predicted enzyme related to lactoylglutathione lyase
MSLRTSRWPAGVPCWVDLTVPDLDAATVFYAAVLGWEFQRFGPEYGDYAIAQVDGAAAAGIGPLPPDGHPAWTLYLASDDVDATATAIGDRGGTLLLPPGDVGPLGRMCIAADPTGAVFGVWQAGQHIGAGIVNESGGLSWEDLRSTDPDAARAIYQGVFGYRTDPLPAAGRDYTTFALAGEPAPLGGMGGLTGGPAGAGSHWLVYFGVADRDAAVAATREHGGTVFVADRDTVYGRMAWLADPDGAQFWVIQAAAPALPEHHG